MRIAISLIILAITGVSCASNSPKINVSNNSKIDLTDKTVILSRKYIEQKLGNSEFEAIYAQSDKDPLPSQCDDIDGDGTWDELAFLIDLKAGESKQVLLKEATKDEYPQFMKRTNVRFGHIKEPYADAFGEPRLKSNDSPTISRIYQMEGPAWENDLVGFRNYYDARNGIDIFGKKTTSMALDSVGIRDQNYHEMDAWGMDILKVANSLGAGAIAIGIGDSLYRVGPCDNANVQMITEGPVRAMLMFTFEGVPAGDRKYDLNHIISISAGNNYYTSSVEIDELKGDEKLVTGIVNKHECALMKAEDVGMEIFATLGAQAYKGENLGLGILVTKDQFESNKVSPMKGEGITETYLIALKLTKDTKASYSFFSGWEYQDEGFKDESYFLEQLKLAAKKITAEILVD